MLLAEIITDGTFRFFIYMYVVMWTVGWAFKTFDREGHIQKTLAEGVNRKLSKWLS